MSRPYSVRFLGCGANGINTAYTVPIGRVAVIRSVTLVTWGTGTGVAAILAGPWYVLNELSLAPGSRSYNEWRVVVYGGEQIVAYLAAANGALTISGWLLEDSQQSSAPAVERSRGRAPAPLPTVPVGSVAC